MFHSDVSLPQGTHGYTTSWCRIVSPSYGFHQRILNLGLWQDWGDDGDGKDRSIGRSQQVAIFNIFNGQEFHGKVN